LKNTATFCRPRLVRNIPIARTTFILRAAVISNDTASNQGECMRDPTAASFSVLARVSERAYTSSVSLS
jgi:hypothetical protein